LKRILLTVFSEPLEAYPLGNSCVGNNCGQICSMRLTFSQIHQTKKRRIHRAGRNFEMELRSDALTNRALSVLT
jgi:hypothetical protein